MLNIIRKIETFSSQEIREKENELIKERRKKLNLDEGNPEKDAIGLALSGGGVRSATFNLGLLQALDKFGFMKWIDYLSTVSGGGYIGSSLSWFLNLNKGTFPFSKSFLDDRPVRWLRLHSSYLTPGEGLNIWALIAAFLRGIFINLIIIIPIFFAVTYFLSWIIITDPAVFFDSTLFTTFLGIGILITLVTLLFYSLYGWISKKKILMFRKNEDSKKEYSWILKLGMILIGIGSTPFWIKLFIFDNWVRGDIFLGLLWYGTLTLFMLLLYNILYAVLSKTKPINFIKHKKFSITYGKMLQVGIISAALGLTPLINYELNAALETWRTEIVSSFSLTGLIFLLTGWIGLKDKDETKGIRAFLLRAGLALIIFVLLLIAYSRSLALHEIPSIDIFKVQVPSYLIILGSVIFSLLIGLASDINHVSMHRYYRDRLLEAYMPEFKKDISDNTADFSNSDEFYLKDMKINESGAPYHILNTNLNTTGSKNLTLRLRGGDNFIFSPAFIGSNATGYQESDKYIKGEMSLATALSISGAAVDPNTGVTRSRPLAFIMTLLNVRLGCWIINPKRRVITNAVAPTFWHTYAFREMMGSGLNEENSFVHLADGGHFENLGLYELVRRKCPYIIISDAGADPKWTFKDLARACELIRADFYADTTLDTRPMHPDKETQYSKKLYVLGDIKYLPDDKNEKAKSSKVIFIKTGVTYDGLPEDIHGYKRINKDFPDESTSDQFFDETQFEAYRELGYKVGEMILEKWKTGNPKDVFK